MCIVNYWPTYFRDLYGGAWPDSYCAIDVETTGYAFDRDVITEWGHCLVEDGKVVDRLSLVINWMDNDLGVPEHWVRSRLEAVRLGMSMSGKVSHMTPERMRRDGMDPVKAMKFIKDFHETLARKGTIFVAHNGVFDEKMLTSNFQAFKVHPAFTFGDNGMLDTDGIEKASQCPTNARVHPKRGDTLRTYFHRVKYTRVEGLKSNMDEHCYHKYKFLAKYGIKPEDMHGAEIDSYCCHLLMREFASQLSDAPEQPPLFPSEEHKESRRPTRAPARTPAPAQPQKPGARLRGQRNS